MINFLLGSLELLKIRKINESILNNLIKTILNIDDDELFNLANSYDLKDYDYDIDLLLEVIDEIIKINNNIDIKLLRIKIIDLKNKQTL